MYLYNLSYKSVDDYLKKNSLPYRILEMAAKFSGMTFVEDLFDIELELPDAWEGSEVKARAFLVKKENGETNCSFQLKFEALAAAANVIAKP